MSILADYYIEGGGKDDALAIRWLRRASRKGHVKSTLRVVRLFPNSTGHEEDVNTLKELGNNGNSAAISALGEMYYEGKGVPRNDTEAVMWHAKVNIAASSGASPLASVTLLLLPNATIFFFNALAPISFAPSPPFPTLLHHATLHSPRPSPALATSHLRNTHVRDRRHYPTIAWLPPPLS